MQRTASGWQQLDRPDPVPGLSSRRLDFGLAKAMASDGSRILVNRMVDNPDLPIRLLLGWRQELARRAGEGWQVAPELSGGGVGSVYASDSATSFVNAMPPSP